MLQNIADIWVLSDDRAGNVSQALGIAEFLSAQYSYEVKKIRYNSFVKLPNLFRQNTLIGMDKSSSDDISNSFPKIIISAGRRSAPIAGYIKKMSGGRSFILQIMYPGDASAKDCDLIALPSHDTKVKDKPNIMRLIGAPNRITTVKLDEETGKWKEKLSHLPKPYHALIVGGSTKNREFTEDMAEELASMALKIKEEKGGSFLMTSSRRTGAKQEKIIADKIGDVSYKYLWGDSGDNPYFAYLALADNIIVTGDSVSMCCEACATTRPVYLYAPKDLVAPKHAKLHEELVSLGYARYLSDNSCEDNEWSHSPLNQTKLIAEELIFRLNKNSSES